jgi:hypothetical protein
MLCFVGHAVNDRQAETQARQSPRGLMPMPSARTTTSAKCSGSMWIDRVTAPGSSRVRKAWMTALLTASEIARRSFANR